MSKRLFILTIAIVLLTLSLPLSAQDIQRTASGKPDLTGNYNLATLTPLQRPREFGDNLYLTPEEAEAIAEKEAAQMAKSAAATPDREAPPEGGAPPVGQGAEALEASGAGAVGGYNAFWIDRGDGAFMVDGKFRTSIIVDPANGQMPGFTPGGFQAISKLRQFFRPNDGTAWWVTENGPGPYDGPESLAISERCLLGFGSVSGPPILPALYNNLKTIVQTEDHVMILAEMVHDARIVRMNSEHVAPEHRRWLGDSIGHWDGDTLVVDTTNFTDTPGLFLASRNLHVIERFTPDGQGNINYHFTVDDPTIWQKPWSGEIIWPKTDDQLYEYACHEGNYAMGNVLRGARLLESEALAASGSA